MSLIRKSLKIITSAPQLPEKNSHSPQIPKTPGGPIVSFTGIETVHRQDSSPTHFEDSSPTELKTVHRQN